MKKIVAIFVSLFLATFLTAYLVAISRADTPAQTGNPGGRVDSGEPLGPRELNPPGEVAVDQDIPLREEREGPVHVMVQLEGAPAAELYASAVAGGESAQAIAETQAHLVQIEAAQEALIPALEAADATILYRVQRVYNGIAITVDAARLAEIGKLEGVAAVHPLPAHTLDHATSVPLIGAPQLWDPAAGGFTGEGISIGIIDTGIDYLHADFGGGGGDDPSLYDSNDPTVTGDVPGFPGVKVVGGYDFAGDNYDADGEVGSPVPQPDPDPMDCNGHGTHVAGTAAGLGVNADGSTYTGPYTATMPFGDFEVAPGVAPGADLYALKVFGCDGTTDLVTMAIEWALDPNGDGDFTDRLDVINMSLGSAYGGEEDVSAVAADNAAAAGIIVVAASGNAGDGYYITDSPASADRALSVASSVDASSRVGAFRVIEPPALAGLHPATEAAFGPDLADVGPVSGTLVLADDGVGVPTDACTPLANAAEISGNIALIDRGECTFVEKVANAQDAGAIGVLVVNNVPNDDPITMGGDDPTITIPSMMTTLEVGDALKAALPGVVVELTAEFRGDFLLDVPGRTDTVSDFSSRGPRRDSFLKPDIAAPGQTIFSAAAGSGNEGVSFNGTSMATPHVAGVMALLREMRPLWTVEELKALAMNTAWHDLRQSVDLASPEYGPGRVGAGRIDAAIASQSEVIAYGTGRPGAVSVNFGEVEVISDTMATRVVRVVNRGTASITYDVSYDARVDMPGVEYTVSPATITVAPNDFEEVEVTMTADFEALRNAHDVTVEENVAGLLRFWLNEEAGYLQLLPSQMVFTADLSGDNEVPPVTTSASGTAVMTYTAATGQLDYTLDSDVVSATMAHIHTGLPGVNGGVIHWLYDVNGTNGPPGPFPVSGSVTLTPNELSMLLSGALYVNVHSPTYPGGEVRDQLQLDGDAPLRVPIYATARPASQMEATQNTIDLSANGVISLTGSDINTGMNFPTDTVSLVTALELQYVSGNDSTSSGAADMADLAAVGVASDYTAAGSVDDAWVFFGLASHGEWASPNEMFYDIYIDSDQDGADDYLLFNWGLGAQGFSPDSMVSALIDLNAGTITAIDYLNAVSPDGPPTYVFNNNVMVLGVPASLMGLSSGDSAFDYYVVTSYREEFVEISDGLTYDIANPGLDFSGGVTGAPIWLDLDGATIEYVVDENAFLANNSRGALLLHHHNVYGQRYELLTTDTGILHLPLVFQQ